jgi:hypothetical protein
MLARTSSLALLAVLAGCGDDDAFDGPAGPDAARVVGLPNIGTCPVFPADNPWNTDISADPVDANSADYIATIGTNGHLHPDFGTRWAGAPNGIPFLYVDSTYADHTVRFTYRAESDPGPYPIPYKAPIEGGSASTGDRHVLAIDIDSCLLYEMWDAHPQPTLNRWKAGSGAIFDLNSNALRTDGFTSADAAGLPVYPGLVKYDEVVTNGVIDHALRFTVADSMSGYIHPATHEAGSCSPASCPDYPPMGLRLRMQANYDCSALSSEVQVICTALKTYGMFVADNGSSWYLSGAPDSRWNDGNLADLGQIPGSAFEVVESGAILQ